MQENLTGAAARGAKAAALGRVKAAADASGGIFLTKEQYDAMRKEIMQLKVTNKRLEDEVVELRVISYETRYPRSEGLHAPQVARSDSSIDSPNAARGGNSPVKIRRENSGATLRSFLSGSTSAELSPSCLRLPARPVQP